MNVFLMCAYKSWSNWKKQPSRQLEKLDMNTSTLYSIHWKLQRKVDIWSGKDYNIAWGNLFVYKCQDLIDYCFDVLGKKHDLSQ